jgi:uncharacterized membrane protein YkoI
MSITNRTRAGIIAGAAVAALALAGVAGTAVANAAGSTPSPSSRPSAEQSTGDTRPQRPVEEQLTGDAAAKVEAAVKAKYPDATIERMEKDADGMSVYEAHITKADGTHVTVLFDASFAITGEQEMGPGGPRGRGGHGGHGPGARPVEEQLTGDAAAKVEAAVKAKYPDATIERMEKDADGMSVYEAHITKADGTHVTVLFDASFAITGEQEMGPGGPGGGRHHGHDAPSGAETGAATSAA